MLNIMYILTVYLLLLTANLTSDIRPLFRKVASHGQNSKYLTVRNSWR